MADQRDMMADPFGPQTNEERIIDAVERLKFDVQYALQAAMAKHDVNRSELARRLGVSKSRVSQMFTDDANLRLNTVARAFAVLDEEIYFGSESVPPIREKQGRAADEHLAPSQSYPYFRQFVAQKSADAELNLPILPMMKLRAPVKSKAE